MNLYYIKFILLVYCRFEYETKYSLIIEIFNILRQETSSHEKKKNLNQNNHKPETIYNYFT